MKLKNILISIFILLVLGGWMFSKQIAEFPFIKNIITKTGTHTDIPVSPTVSDSNNPMESFDSDKIADTETLNKIYAKVDAEISNIPDDAVIQDETGQDITKPQLRQKLVQQELTDQGYSPNSIFNSQTADTNGADVQSAKPSTPQDKTAFPPKQKDIAKETTISIAETYIQRINLPAIIDSKGYLSITSRINNATIKKILVKNGQQVKKGQLLIELSSDFIPEQYQDHKEKYNIAVSKFNADKKLYEQKLISEYAFKQSQNAMTSAKVRMLATKRTYDHHFIRAPFSGVVDMVYVNTFNQVMANTKLLDLNDQKSYTIKTSLPINALAHVQIGTEFIATTVTGKKIQGYISGISSNANPQTSTYEGEGTIATKGTFNIGEPVSVQILGESVLAHNIPLSQVLLDDDGNIAIKVVENGIVTLKPVTILWEDLTIAKVTGLGDKAEIFTLGAGFADVGTPYPPVSENTSDTQGTAQTTPVPTTK